MPPQVVVLTGPTATGKTKLGVMLAQKLGGEVVGADSMQIYKYMNIGTAKPTAEEMAGIPHHMIDVVSPFENYSVSRYVEDASACVNEILSRGKLPVLVGGTGLYIESLLSGRNFAENGSFSGLRERLSEQYDEFGGAEMLSRLREVDPESAARLHPNDKKRIVRALEVYQATGKTITRHNLETQALPPRYTACKIALTFNSRQNLYDRIDRRVDGMVAAGLESEVQTLLSMGLTAKHTAMQAIGYKEMACKIFANCTLEEAVSAIKTESRRYAKRQLSWLGRDKSLHWIRWEKEPDFAAGLRDSTGFFQKDGII